MQNLNYSEVVRRHPEVQQDRYGLCFTSEAAPSDVAAALSRFGVVMLRDVLPKSMLASCSETFRRFTRKLGHKRRWPNWRWPGGDAGPDPQWNGGEKDAGSWHRPWVVRDGVHRPAAAVIAALLKSWAWPIVEEISGSSELAILLAASMARHAIDRELGVGAHQDAKVVAAEIPFAIWIPFHDVVPGKNSGLGFVVNPPDHILPTLPHDDVGPDYVLSRLDQVWMPAYQAGDISVHSRYSAHFTTGYGTLADRYSQEIRVMPRASAPANYLNPALYVERRKGIPTITGMECPPGTAARRFLATAVRLAASVQDAPDSIHHTNMK